VVQATKQSQTNQVLAVLGWKGITAVWHIINAIYEEYCQAQIDEMLKLDA